MRKNTSKDLVFDAAFNPAVTDECSQSSILDEMLMLLVLEYVEKMTDLKVLDGKKCKKVRLCHSHVHVSLKPHGFYCASAQLHYATHMCMCICMFNNVATQIVLLVAIDITTRFPLLWWSVLVG